MNDWREHRGLKSSGFSSSGIKTCGLLLLSSHLAVLVLWFSKPEGFSRFWPSASRVPNHRIPLQRRTRRPVANRAFIPAFRKGYLLLPVIHTHTDLFSRL